MYRYVILICCLIIGSACQRERVWLDPSQSKEKDPNNVSEIDGRLILLAPAAMDAIKDTYSEAPRGYAKQVINWLERGVGSTTFLYAPSLPDASAAIWGTGPIAAAAGSNLVILVALDSLEEVPGVNAPGGPRTDLLAKVTMRVIDAQGQTVWQKTHTAQVENSMSPKFRSGPGSAPGRAVWNANKKCISALKDWLDAKSDKETFGKEEPVQPKPQLGQVKVHITSTPLGADVLVDGQFKGNTPLDVYLPLKEVEISIERGGYQAWRRKLKPSTGLEIKPILSAK